MTFPQTIDDVKKIKPWKLFGLNMSVFLLVDFLKWSMILSAFFYPNIYEKSEWYYFKMIRRFLTHWKTFKMQNFQKSLNNIICNWFKVSKGILSCQTKCLSLSIQNIAFVTRQSKLAESMHTSPSIVKHLIRYAYHNDLFKLTCWFIFFVIYSRERIKIDLVHFCSRDKYKKIYYLRYKTK